MAPAPDIPILAAMAVTPWPAALPWLWPVLAAPFIGSFIALLAIRLPEGEKVLWGRSRCRSCGQALGALDLVPVASWVLARGRCRHCAAPVSSFYPGVELGALAVALWAALALPVEQLWASCLLGWGLLALAIIDARDFWLPDRITLPLVAFGLIVAAILDRTGLADHVIGAAAGFACFAAIAFIYRRLRGRDGLGRGDAKLMAVAGAWVAWEGLASVVLIAAVASLAWLLLARRREPLRSDSTLPFGPGLCLGIWLVWLYGTLS
jgi:leader peptidase (prepilin peptidase)/N-methyltransferase